MLLLVQVVLTLTSVQRLTVSDADCCRPRGWDFIPDAATTTGRRRGRRRLELQQVVVTFGTNHRLPIVYVLLLGLFVRVMLQRLESFVFAIPVMIVVVQLFEVRARLELVVQFPRVIAIVAADAVLVVTVWRRWGSLFVMLPPYRGLWTAFVWWTGMIRQGAIRLTPVLVELIVTVD